MSGESNYNGFVEDFVPRIQSVDDFYSLFKRLGYPSKAVLDRSYRRRVGEFGFANEEEEKIANIYTVLSIEKNLNIFLVETKSPVNVTVRFLRYLAKVFSDHYLRFLLIVTGDFRTIVFVLPDFEKKDVGELKLKIIRLQIDVKDLYYTDKQTIASLGLTGQEKDWRDIWLKWRDAFNVRRVTDKFFEEYAGAPDSVFFKIRKELVRQKISRKDAHEFTLQFLNRIMFVYFVAKKRWLNNEPRFMRWLWQRYLKERNNDRAPMDSFYEKWLKTIFFEAFNNKFTPHSDLPEDVNRIFYTVPYLNGGLFREEDIDELPVKIKDGLFQEVFEFFERYNFTIREDLPFDVEVAVDPQMIGYVYESLAKVAEEIYDRNDLGIFYTPRVEVDFMCRRALVEYLHNHMPKVSKELWYRLVFDEDTESVEKQLSQLAGFWYDLEERLDAISVVDPACGSGGFLVGMLNVLTSLYKIVNRNLGRSKPDFEIKKRIVGKSLYGVDVMPWAVHAAELRLWLQLVVESPLEPKDLRTYPLLPNLNMNLRVGDSLVQEIGGMTLHLRDPKLSEKVKKKLVELKQEKENYINNVPTAKFKTKEEVQKEEIRIFEEITEERLQFIENEIKNIRSKIKGEESQKTLTGERATFDEEKRKKIEQFQMELERYNREEYELKRIRENLITQGKKPFVWDIDFAEIFGDKAGFDIVIGNPPYVKEGKISPPNKLKEDVTLEDRKAYKDKLLQSVKTHFPILEKVPRTSDYYVYFYFHGLSLLNRSGTFCFITSNAWLDVGYGSALQEFLLKYVPIIAIYDNQVKRVFEHADINTVIALFGSARIGGNQPASIEGLCLEQSGWPALSSIARFVMFGKPYEEVVNSKNLLDIERVTEIKRTDEYHVYPIIQDDLLEDGWEYPEEYDREKLGRFKQGKYSGNKWGGKYLRAPNVFFTIMEKGRDQFLELKKLASVLPGCYSGINDFFYVDGDRIQRWKIEQEYLFPLIRDSSIVDKLKIGSTKGHYVIACDRSKSELRKLGHKGILSYIEWGEKQKTRKRQKTEAGIPWPKVETVKNRKPCWWSIPYKNLLPTNLFMQYVSNDRFYCPYSQIKLTSDRCFHRIFPRSGYDPKIVAGFLNSSLVYLFVMGPFGRSNLGMGALKFEATDANKLLVLNPEKFSKEEKNKISEVLDELGERSALSVFEECGIDPNTPIREQEPSPLSDRKKLDDIVFGKLELGKEDRKEIYWAICELVKNRLEKAESLKEEKE